MSIPTHPNSWYAASIAQPTRYPTLNDAIDVDVCVIGGGITGCSAALHLAQAGYRVALLEAARIGWGASGRSGGQIIFGYTCEQRTLTQLVGAQESRLLWDLSLAALIGTRRLIAQHDIACDLTAGMAHVAVKPRQVKDLQAWYAELTTNYQYQSVQLWEQAELQAQLASPRYFGALYDPNSGHLHPLKYTLGLAEAAAAAEAQLFEGTAVTQLQQGVRPVLHTASGGQVRCDAVILAGNAYLRHVLPEIEQMVMPVSTYMIATAPLAEAQAHALICNRMAVADMNYVLDYFRLSADNRLLFGGLASYSTWTPAGLKSLLQRRMQRVFPQLSAVTVEYVWGGEVAITLNRAPHFGRVGQNVYFAHGFSGHGVALAGLAGQLMAEAVAGTQERFDVFAHIPHHPFPGGRWLRMPALVLGNAYYKLRDLL